MLQKPQLDYGLEILERKPHSKKYIPNQNKQLASQMRYKMDSTKIRTHMDGRIVCNPLKQYFGAM